MRCDIALLVASLASEQPSGEPTSSVATSLHALASHFSSLEARLARLEGGGGGAPPAREGIGSGTSARQPWQVGRSSCPGTQGFRPASVFPERAPLVWVDYLIPEVRGKVVVEIGEREGDIILCLARHARKAYVVEQDPIACKALRAHDPERRVEIACERITPSNGVDLLPDGDVYVWWNEPTANRALVDLVHGVLKKRKRTAAVFFGFDGSSNLDDMPHVAPMLEHLKSREFGHSGNITRLFFDEEAEGEGLYGDGPPAGAAADGLTADGELQDALLRAVRPLGRLPRGQRHGRRRRRPPPPRARGPARRDASALRSLRSIQHASAGRPFWCGDSRFSWSCLPGRRVA